MPLINGQKMACEPCIRGHRSTKCTHANERLMVPVRKPGRPLSTCPHPSSRPCSCGQVTAAIPKKQKCHCGTKNEEAPPLKSERDDSSEELTTTPQSPSKPASSAYRIHKPTSNSSASSRKPSVDVAGLERMDVGQLNILPAYNAMSPKAAPPLNNGMPSLPDMSAYSAMGLTPAESPYGPMVFPMFQPQMPPPMMSSDARKAMANGHSAKKSDDTATNTPDETDRKVGSCCGGGSNGASATISPQPYSAPGPTEQADKKPKSCCSSNISSPKIEPNGDILPQSEVSTPNGIIISPFQTPLVMPNGMYPYYPQPTIFTYPPNYGSYIQPLQPEQWRQMMESMTFGQPNPMPSPYGIPGAVPYQPPTAPHSSIGTSHQCSCGEACQCVGCAAHPYNEATKTYVRSAWESMIDDSHRHSHGPHAQAHHNHTNGNASTNGNSNGISNGVTNGHMNGTHESPMVNGMSNGNPVSAAGSADGTRSPTAPLTPSETASALSEEQTLSASDFFFVSYPFGDSCAGDTASCPCGDDCQCLGCVIHNNPGPTSETEAQPS
ncbi:hypothetical protein G7046_g9762 [Stylonectria norvegica]|nr:hypothetical protein G7046_g9762 [Stylonectria norvegica]